VILAGFEIRLRLPVHVQRVHAFYCERCRDYFADPDRGRCERCHGPLRRVWP
jgi:rRNA maturation endonuclease Nob1